MPSFVYLLPALALFGTTRFTAIFASIIYAVPPVVRLVEDGIRAVPATVVEAATSAGSTPGQLLWKVQLPMARRAILLAANQGIVMTLAMVVVGGLVGAGALGYDVVVGFSQRTDFGMGLRRPASRSVLLGVMLDRITQGADRRPSPTKGMNDMKIRLLAGLLAPRARGAGCGGARSKTRVQLRRAGRPPGSHVRRGRDREDRDQPLGGLRGQRQRRGVPAEERARLHVKRPKIKEAARLGGLRDRRRRRHHRELGPPGPQKKFIDEKKVAVDGGLDRQQGRHRLVRPQVDGRQVPRHHRLQEPEQVRQPVQDLRVRRQGPAPRRRPVATSPTTRPWSRTSSWTSRSSRAAARPP